MSEMMTLRFRGWFQCRMATDPDPTWEPRGVSGYTLAFGWENNLDRVLRLQRDEIADADYRPAENGIPEVGVTVTEVEGVGAALTDLLRGVSLRLDGDPVYESWNQVVGDGVQRIAPLVVPFRLRFERDGACLLARSDPLPGGRPLWELGADPGAYADRVPAYVRRSDEVIEELGLVPEDLAPDKRSPWFANRAAWLFEALAESTEGSVERLMLERRLALLSHYSSSANHHFLDNRLGLQAVWDHPVRGSDAIVGEPVAAALREAGLAADVDSHWDVRYWHGGWDGDLMRGLMKGRLDVPLRPSDSREA